MQTYCEVKTGKSINWYDRLNELKQLFKTNSIEYERKKALYHKDSLRWITCACGNTCDIIPRENSSMAGPGKPVDDTLSYLGASFPSYIRTDNHDGGLNCLDRIEKRSAILIQEELKKRYQ